MRKFDSCRGHFLAEWFGQARSTWPSRSGIAVPSIGLTQWSVTKAEWIKLRSVRANVVGIAAAAVALVLLGVLFSGLVRPGDSID